MSGEERRVMESVGQSASFATMALEWLTTTPEAYAQFAAWLAVGGKMTPAPTVEQLAIAGSLLDLMADKLFLPAKPAEQPSHHRWDPS